MSEVRVWWEQIVGSRVTQKKRENVNRGHSQTHVEAKVGTDITARRQVRILLKVSFHLGIIIYIYMLALNSSLIFGSVIHTAL